MITRVTNNQGLRLGKLLLTPKNTGLPADTNMKLPKFRLLLPAKFSFYNMIYSSGCIQSSRISKLPTFWYEGISQANKK